jgi:glycosyltransferase involved in cell wall biosynthesis
MLVRVMAIIVKSTEIKCIILGAGHYSPQKDHLVKLIKNYNLDDKIELIEWLDRKDALQVIAGSKLYVSSSRYEGLPLSVVEAMGLGKACIVTDVDGNRDCVENGKTGAVVPVNNDAFMAERIVNLLTDESERKKLEKAALERFNTFFNLEITGTNLFEVYKKIKTDMFSSSEGSNNVYKN